MSDHEAVQQQEGFAAVRSGVKLEQTSKGPIQVKVSVYEGTTETEMQRVKDLAIRTLEVAIREIDALNGLSTTSA